MSDDVIILLTEANPPEGKSPKVVAVRDNPTPFDGSKMPTTDDLSLAMRMSPNEARWFISGNHERLASRWVPTVVPADGAGIPALPWAAEATADAGA